MDYFLAIYVPPDMLLVVARMPRAAQYVLPGNMQSVAVGFATTVLLVLRRYQEKGDPRTIATSIAMRGKPHKALLPLAPSVQQAHTTIALDKGRARPAPLESTRTQRASRNAKGADQGHTVMSLVVPSALSVPGASTASK